MSVQPTAIDGLFVVQQPTHEDERGFFRQTFVVPDLADALGHTPTFVQGNHARSAPGVLRGFHAEPWDKLITVTAGVVQAVVADVRPDSPTFGRHVSVLLGDAPGARDSLYLAAGLGNAYCVVGDQPADYVYCVTAVWQPGADKRDVRWDDPTLAVAWPTANPTLSADDAAAPTLRERFPNHEMFA